LRLDLQDQAIVLTPGDGGLPFDPTRPPAPPPSQSLDARTGGLGLLLVHKVARRLEYERTATQRNRLRVTVARE
jgi:anti-sigma regulatory factor (Ser/Thr protein kinase)